MKTSIVNLAMLFLIFCSFSVQAENTYFKEQYSETKSISKTITKNESFKVVNRLGNVDIIGIEGLSEISVEAEILLSNAKKEDISKIIKEKLVLSFEQIKNEITLNSYIDLKEENWFAWMSKKKIQIIA